MSFKVIKLGFSFAVLGIFSLLILSDSLSIVSGLLLHPSEVLKVSFHRQNVLFLVSELLVGIANAVVLAFDLKSEAILCLLKLGVLTVEPVELVLEILDVSLKSLSLFSEVITLCVVVVKIALKVSVLVFGFEDLPEELALSKSVMAYGVFKISLLTLKAVV